MREVMEMAAFVVGGTVVLMMMVIMVIATMYVMIDPPSCAARWRDSAFEHRWSFWSGCQLKLADGTWLTDDAYLQMNRTLH